MPRGVFTLGLGLLVVAEAFLVTCEVLGPSPGVTEANVRRIKVGMSLEEVEAILGGPCRVGPGPGKAPPWLRSWEGRCGFAAVSFGVTDRVDWPEWISTDALGLP